MKSSIEVLHRRAPAGSLLPPMIPIGHYWSLFLPSVLAPVGPSFNIIFRLEPLLHQLRRQLLPVATRRKYRNSQWAPSNRRH